MRALSKGYYPGVLMQPDQLHGITSLGFWNGSGAQDWGLEAHRNEGVEICFLETGAMPFSVEAKKFKLKSGQFTITRPWQLHKLGAPNIGPGKLHWLILDVGVRRPNQDWRWPRWVALTPDDKSELTRKLRHNENAVWNSSPALANAFRGLVGDIVNWNEPHVESRMITLLNQLLLGILIALTEQQTEQNPNLTSRRRTVELFLRDLSENSLSRSQSRGRCKRWLTAAAWASRRSANIAVNSSTSARWNISFSAGCTSPPANSRKTSRCP